MVSVSLHLWLTLFVCSFVKCRPNDGRQILVFGGNGFMGASTVDLLLKQGNNVTIVNRGNWYWDSRARVLPHVHHIQCDRKSRIEQSCQLLINHVKKVGSFDAVIDFSAYGRHEVLEAATLLRDRVQGLYVLISTDSVYDVCKKKHDGPSMENDAVRPDSAEEVERLSHFHAYGHNKLEAEEALIRQRLEGGYPFVMLRLPDVIGPRDTTHRFWMYQLWVKLASLLESHPVLVPHFLDDYPISFVYSEDVVQAILQVMDMGPQIRDQVINLAYPQTVTLAQFLEDVQNALDIKKRTYAIQDSSATNHMYFYPSVRKGPVSVTKANDLLKWSPTPWKDVIESSVRFYEDAMVNDHYQQQRNEVIQVLASYVFTEDRSAYYDAIEKAYNIDLSHFKNAKDEL